MKNLRCYFSEKNLLKFWGQTELIRKHASIRPSSCLSITRRDSRQLNPAAPPYNLAHENAWRQTPRDSINK